MPPKWLVAPADMGPVIPDLGAIIRLWQMSNKVGSAGVHLTMDDIWRTFKPL